MTPCIEHTGYCNADGYGIVSRGGRNHKAHRWAWMLAHGPIPDGMVVMHTCDNPPCVNELHLRLGTQAENVADMRAKNRGNNVTGVACHTAKLTPDRVRFIRRKRAEGWTAKALAAFFRVDRATICDVVAGRTWRTVS